MRFPKLDGSLKERRQIAVACCVAGLLVNLVAVAVNLFVFRGWASIAFLLLHTGNVGACMWGIHKVTNT